MSHSDPFERVQVKAATDWLKRLLSTRASAAAYDWLSAQMVQPSTDVLASGYAAAGRKLGAAPLALDPRERDSLERLTYAGFKLPCLRDLGRACLLLSYASSAALTEIEDAVSVLYYKGDANEQTVVLRCLALLPCPTQYTLIATDAARSHVQPVFEALACENPYPGEYLDDAAFNQIVIKAFFTGVGVRRILGLARRDNPDLRRMAQDFASERRAAGRSVPPDLEQVVTVRRP